ncbi:MAG TPA: MarR family transcriptional regulator [Gemmatimonadales bacterium]|nr:MarR family transcriptional regulator [Gemmatimonadales bacterium]
MAQEAIIGIARTASVLNRQAASVLEPEGISVAQFNVLRILRGAGADGLPTLSIRDRMVDPAAAITRLVDKLEEAGLITRERVSCDRRQVVCRITAKGLELLSRVDPLMSATEDRLSDRLTSEEMETLNELLTKVRQGAC